MVTSITALRCICDRCGNSWVSFKDTPPLRCPECGSREWNGVKLHLRSHVNELWFPAPRTQGRPKTFADDRFCLMDDLD